MPDLIQRLELNHLSALTVYVLLVAALLGLYYYHAFNRTFRLLALWVWFSLAVEVAARWAGMQYRNNLPVYHAYAFGEWLLFGFFYREILDARSWPARHWKALVPMVSVVLVLNSAFIEPLFTALNVVAKSTVQLLIVWFALDVTFTLPDDDHPPHDRNIRLVNSAVLLYYSGSLFIFLFSKLAPNNEGGYGWLWSLNIVLHSALVAAVATAFVRIGRRSR